ncbi:MAG: 6-phospho-3-hexuloisomerase [Anaerolineae bacterium]
METHTDATDIDNSVIGHTMHDYYDLIMAVLDEVAFALHSVSDTQVATLRLAIHDASRVFIAGKGRSGLLARAFALRLMHLGLTIHVVDEVTTPAIMQGDLLILISGSGETASILQYSAQARSHGAKVALITAFPNSSIAQRSDIVVHIPAPSVKADVVNEVTSFQPMANMFEQSLMLLLDVITLQLMSDLGLTQEQLAARHANLE